MGNLYLVANGVRSGSSPVTKVATGTSLKTLLQIVPDPTKLRGSGQSGVGGMRAFKIKEWGISFDGNAAATPIQVELIETNGYATVSPFSIDDFIRFDNYYSPDPPVVVGASASGYNASAEGTIYGTRLLDLQLIAPTNQYVKQFPLGQEPVVTVWYGSGNYTALRIRVLAGASVNAYCYVLFEV